MRYWRPDHNCGTDEYFLEAVATPRWAVLVRDTVEGVDARLGHLLCGEGLPDHRWLYPLAGWLHQSFSWVLFLPDRLERVFARFPTTLEWAEVFGYVPPEDEDEEEL